jgi:hypothetical protein
MTTSGTLLTDRFEQALKLAKSKDNNVALETWLKNELDGYSGTNVPEYRKAKANSVCWNPVRQEWIPLRFDKEGLNEVFNNFPIKNSLRELEAAIKSAHPDGNIYLSFSQDVEHKLISESGMFGGMKPAVEISLPVFQNILMKIKRELDEKTRGLAIPQEQDVVRTPVALTEQQLSSVRPESEFLGMKGTPESLLFLAVLVVLLYITGRFLNIGWLDNFLEHDSVLIAFVFCINYVLIKSINWWRSRIND